MSTYSFMPGSMLKSLGLLVILYGNFFRLEAISMMLKAKVLAGYTP
jgi:hypothetical protein